MHKLLPIILLEFEIRSVRMKLTLGRGINRYAPIPPTIALVNNSEKKQAKNQFRVASGTVL